MRGVGVGKLWGVWCDLSFPTFTGAVMAEGTLIVCGSLLFAGRRLKAVSAVSGVEGHSGLSAHESATQVPGRHERRGTSHFDLAMQWRDERGPSLSVSSPCEAAYA